MHQVLTFALHGDSIELDCAELQRKRQLLADAEDQPAGGRRAKLVVGASGHVVGAEGRSGRTKVPDGVVRTVVRSASRDG